MSKKVTINNTELVEAFRAEGGKILHVRPTPYHRGVTFAYEHQGGRLTFSTAVQHVSDTFTKKEGTRLAIERFSMGQCVTLPVKGKSSDINGILRWIVSDASHD